MAGVLKRAAAAGVASILIGAAGAVAIAGCSGGNNPEEELKNLPQKPADLPPVDEATKASAPGTIDYK